MTATNEPAGNALLDAYKGVRAGAETRNAAYDRIADRLELTQDSLSRALQELDVTRAEALEDLTADYVPKGKLRRLTAQLERAQSIRACYYVHPDALAEMSGLERRRLAASRARGLAREFQIQGNNERGIERRQVMLEALLLLMGPDGGRVLADCIIG